MNINTKIGDAPKGSKRAAGSHAIKFISVKYHLLFCNFNYLYIEAMQKYD
ncbi:hypothetical protein Sjap_002463 [Stephania japonica]|uniref:Uncharacterized protein n=1 Tax=Stephania japonica TaxID=461633 RepID=A0AAP0KNI1_9MAGN